MPNDAKKSIEIEFTIQFERDMRRLSKKYRRVKSDVKPIIWPNSRHPSSADWRAYSFQGKNNKL